MIPLLTARSRLIPFAIILIFALPLLLYQLSGSTQAQYTFPKGVLVDYTSPSTHCFWPETDTDAVDFEQVEQGGGSTGRIKEWMGWGSSTSEGRVIPGTEEKVDEQFAWEGQLPDVIPVTGIERYMLAHIEELQEGYDSQHDLDEYGLKSGNISLTAYTSELLSTYKIYLLPEGMTNPPSHPPSYLPPVLSRLSLRPPIAPLPPRPKQVMTTDKSIDDIPQEFERWKEMMPDWEIKYFDDKALKSWVKGVFGKSKAEKIWQGLPRQVLKTDVFRYMKAVSTQTAAPIIHADEWGQPYHHDTPPLLTHLSRLLSLSTSPHLPSSHPLSAFSPDYSPETLDVGIEVDLPTGKSQVYDGPIVNDGSELGEPSLVVSVESDAIDFGWTNWRDVGLSRAVQITQWTFMARPGHPVFLDALGRTLRKSEEIAQQQKDAKATGKEIIPETALEWTGPGIFSDCVYRYMLARYGFKPSDLIHRKEPLRVGDVLILPAGSFSSVSPFGDEEQRPWAASWHGFLGRWRHADPGVQEFERLKKLKEEAEEAEEQAKEEAEEAERKSREAEDRAREADEAERKAKAEVEVSGRRGEESVTADGE
nr:uncharacterized protein CI109_001120 [Kwoniella shandongensis]KAA5530319.1 hypothetical protein CI109_001120 [Kwoniella shandongensis]